MNSASMFHPADCTKSPSISENPISRNTERIVSISACIGCGLPPEGVGAGALTSNGLNLASLHPSPCSSSGVTSPISSTSSRADTSTVEPASVRVQLLETRCSTTIRPLREEKWLTMSAFSSDSSTGPSANNPMKADLCLMAESTAPSSSTTKRPSSRLIPRTFSKPTPGPASLRLNSDESVAIVLLSGPCFLSQPHSRSSSSPSVAADLPSSPSDTELTRSSETSARPNSSRPAPAPATCT